jgi:hypothetical protein
MRSTLHRTISTAFLTVIASILSGAVCSTLAAEAPNVCDWTGLWAPGGTLAAKRDGATATTLQDGRVLVVGGYDGANTVGFAELYNPGSATFTTTGSLITDRTAHVATLLPDGRVLIAGGIRIAGGVFNARLSSAEIFDPATGNFTPAASMGTDRQNAAAVLLANGKVLVTGGFGKTAFGYSNYLQSAEIFDPATGAFSATGAMVTGRGVHQLTRLNSGRVLVTGGTTGFATTNTAELFDPATGAFAATGAMQQPRMFHTATLLPSGSVILTGGSNSNGFLASTETFSPSTGTFFNYSSLGIARAAHTAILLPIGKLLIVGGENTTGALASAEVTGPNGGFVPLPALPASRSNHAAALVASGDVLLVGGRNGGGSLDSAVLYDPLFSATGAMSTMRSHHTATRLVTGQVLIAGGYDGVTPFASAELYNPATRTFAPTGSMSVARHLHTATTLPDGRVLIAGGFSNFNSGAAATAELYDPFTGGFSVAGSMSIARQNHTATLLPNGKVLIAGGSPAGTPTNSAELYDPTTNTFSPTGSMNKDRIYHTATLLPTGQVLITGGWSNAEGGIAYSTELYDPGAGTFTSPPQAQWLWTNRELHVATLLSSGKVLITGGLTSGITPTKKAEIYDPWSGYFSPVGDMSTPRARHAVTGTDLPNGAVMVLGGQSSFNNNTLATVELFDPSTNMFSVTGSMQLSRYDPTATLLADTRVLVAGGSGDFGGNPAVAELSKPTHCGPMITMLTPSSGGTGTSVTISGSQFDSMQNGSTVTFNGALAPVGIWSDTSIVTTVPAGATTGPLVVTVNGRASNGPTFSVIATSPDLIEKMKSPPMELTSGSRFNVVDSASNKGTATAGPSTTRYYFSIDVVKDKSDVLLIGSRAVPALAPAMASSATTSVTVPKIASGSYYLLACADDLNAVAESDETNNCVASASMVLVW